MSEGERTDDQIPRGEKMTANINKRHMHAQHDVNT